MGADSVVIQEDTKADGNKITILEAPTLGRHIRKAGLDFKRWRHAVDGGQHTHDPRRGAGGGDEPAVAQRSSEATRGNSLYRRLSL